MNSISNYNTLIEEKKARKSGQGERKEGNYLLRQPYGEKKKS